MTTSEAAPPSGYVALVRRNANFRNLWFGQIVSLLGDWFNLIASASLIALLTGSGVAIGTLFVIRYLAPFIVSPLAGVAADRYNRKNILIVADLTRAVTLLGFLLVRDAGDVWLLYVLTAIQLGISGFFFPTQTSILPDIVQPRGLGAANALSSATWSVMLALGAALGGLVAGIWGNYTAFVIDAITFLASALFISRIRGYAPPVRAAEASVMAALHEYVAGLRYMAGHADILVIALQKAAASLIIFATFDVVRVEIASEVFVIGVGGGIGLGALLSITGISTGVGPIAARTYTGDDDGRLRRAILLGFVCCVLGMALAATLLSFGVVMVGSFIRGLGGGIIWVFSTQLLLQLVPGHVRGRVFANEFAFWTLTSAAGAAAAGLALDSPLGISGSLWLTAALALIPTLFWLWWLTRGRCRPAVAEESA